MSTTLRTPLLTDRQLAAVKPVVHDAGAKLEQDADAVACSVECPDEIAGARLLASVNDALDRVMLARLGVRK